MIKLLGEVFLTGYLNKLYNTMHLKILIDFKSVKVMRGFCEKNKNYMYYRAGIQFC